MFSDSSFRCLFGGVSICSVTVSAPRSLRSVIRCNCYCRCVAAAAAVPAFGVSVARRLALVLGRLSILLLLEHKELLCGMLQRGHLESGHSSVLCKKLKQLPHILRSLTYAQRSVSGIALNFVHLNGQ